MKNITVEFTYDLPDDQYYQTNELKKTGTLTYTGPETKYIQINSETNLMTGDTIEHDEFQDYNNEDDGYYAVEVDCSTNPLICAIVDAATQVTGTTIVTEEIPGDTVDYTRDDPPRPDHTYEVKQIKYDPVAKKFVKPYPWKQPYVTWEAVIAGRNSALKRSDLRLSEDLPTSLYNNIAEYRQYLRDFPEAFGAAWKISITAGGTGFIVGDRILISDSVYKNNSSTNDIVIRVTEVDDNGSITSISKESSVHAYKYHPEAGTYNDVYHTTNSVAGTGSVIQISKVKLIDPWKITMKDIVVDSIV